MRQCSHIQAGVSKELYDGLEATCFFREAGGDNALGLAPWTPEAHATTHRSVPVHDGLSR